MDCGCDFCTEHRRIEAIRTGEDIAAMRQLIEDLENRAIHAELDRDVNNAILDGKWPEAKDRLTKALEKCAS